MGHWAFSWANGALFALAVGGVLLGCGGGDEPPKKTLQPPPPPPMGVCHPGAMPIEGGACQPAGLPPGGPICGPGEVESGAGCRPAGVPADACAEGFTAIEQRCAPILPNDPCAPGQMAIPGETQCRPVAPCEAGDYGGIPAEADTHYVNASYAGGSSDGSIQKPWLTIQDAVDAAADGAIVAVAAGTYTEAIDVSKKKVRLWGRCPELVQVVAPPLANAAIAVYGGGDGSEIHTLALSGPGNGVLLLGAELTLDRLWIHDTGDYAIDIEDGLGESMGIVKGTLIESATAQAVFARGAKVTLEESVVRDTKPTVSGSLGIGVAAYPGDFFQSEVTLRRSVVERSRAVGVFLRGALGDMEASVVRDTKAEIASGAFGRSVISQGDSATKQRGGLKLRTSVIDGADELGVYAAGADVTIEATTVTGAATTGVHSENQLMKAVGGPTLTVRDSFVEQGAEAGITFIATQGSIEGTLVRGTVPVPPVLGAGVFIQNDEGTSDRSKVTIQSSVIDGARGGGLFAAGSDVSINGTAVRNTLEASDGTLGRGMSLQNDPDGEVGVVDIAWSLVEHSYERGIVVLGAMVTIESTVVRDVKPEVNGLFAGRGMEIQADEAGRRAGVQIRTSIIEDAHEAGVQIFGSDVTIEATTIARTKEAADLDQGVGVMASADKLGLRASLTMRWCIVEENATAGVGLAGSDGLIESTLIRDNKPRALDNSLGRGIVLQPSFLSPAQMPAFALVKLCNIERNHEMGIGVSSSDLVVEDTIVRDTNPSLGDAFGDGIFIVNKANRPPTASLTGVRLENNARAGVGNYGGTVSIQSVVNECNSFDFLASTHAGSDASLNNLGENVCGCGGVVEECTVELVELAAPEDNWQPPEPLTP